MKNKRGIIFSIFVISITVAFLLQVNLIFAAQPTEPPAMPPLPLIRAMGNAYTAVSDDENSVFFNPAGYGTIESGIVSVFSLGVKANIDSSAIKLYDALISGVNLTSTTNITKYLTNTTVSPGVAGPIYFGRVGNNFGFAFYDNVSITLITNPGAILPTAELDAYSDLGFVGGYGMPIPFIKNLYAGLNMKIILRVKTELEGTVLAVIDEVSNTSDLPLAKAIGFGGDFGFLYKPLPWLSLGIAGKDFFGTRFGFWSSLDSSEQVFTRSYIKPRIALGIAFYPLQTIEESTQTNKFIIALDYSDLFDFSSVLSNIKFGVSFTPLKVLTLRGGIDGGYFTGGIGINLKIFHINVVYFVDELGAYPGANPIQNLMLNLAFRW